jgi:hypothetical protein
MINRVPARAVAGLLAAGLAALPGAASATPLTGAFAIANAAPGHVEAVRWAGGGAGRGPVVAGARGYGGGYGRGPVGGPGWRGPGGGGPVYGGGGGGGGGWGYGVGAAVVGGAIIGGALAAPYYYGYNPYYPAPYPYYAEPVYEAAPAPPPPDAYAPPPGAGAYGPPPGEGGDPSRYCAQRYQSYDPASGTYIGNDGLRHPCP